MVQPDDDDRHGRRLLADLRGGWSLEAEGAVEQLPGLGRPTAPDEVQHPRIEGLSPIGPRARDPCSASAARASPRRLEERARTPDRLLGEPSRSQAASAGLWPGWTRSPAGAPDPGGAGRVNVQRAGSSALLTQTPAASPSSNTAWLTAGSSVPRPPAGSRRPRRGSYGRSSQVTGSARTSGRTSGATTGPSPPPQGAPAPSSPRRSHPPRPAPAPLEHQVHRVRATSRASSYSAAVGPTSANGSGTTGPPLRRCW